MTYEKPILGEYKVEEPDITNFRKEMGVHQVTGAELGPFLKMHPEAALVVRIDQWLVPVRDVFYDNEFGLHVLEIDLTIDDAPPTPPGP